MNNDNETQIVWRLTKAEKGRYVAAARGHVPPLPLVGWLKKVADAASEPVDQGERHVDEPLRDSPGEGEKWHLARERPRMDDGRGSAPGDDA